MTVGFIVEMGVWSRALFYIFIYLPVYFIFTLIQRFYWICNGMYDIVNQIENGQLYERSAQVFDIRWKLKKEDFQTLSRWNWIGTHASFEHPSFVLRHDVSLICCQLDMAVFVQTPPEYDIFDCRQSPFIHLGQFDQAYRIVTLPIASLIRLGNELGDPKAKVIWLHSTGRCGSTALGQVFEVIPNCITISEPMPIFTLRLGATEAYGDADYRAYLKDPIYLEAMRAIMRLLAKPNQHKPETILIKNFTLSGVNELPEMEKLIPNQVHLFLYRDCLATVKSYLKSLNSHFWMGLVMSLRSNAALRYVIRSPHLLLKSLSHPEVIDGNQWLDDSALQLRMSAFGLLVMQWATLCDYYNRVRVTGRSSVRAIRYEDIVENKIQTLRLLFQYCGISEEYLELAKKSLETDSQIGTVLAKSNLAKHKQNDITSEMMNEANFYLRGFNLPPLNQPVYLPGVISPAAGTN